MAPLWPGRSADWPKATPYYATALVTFQFLSSAVAACQAGGAADTPMLGSWLNLVEGFLSKLARSVLRHIRVASKQELKDRIMHAIGVAHWMTRSPLGVWRI